MWNKHICCSVHLVRGCKEGFDDHIFNRAHHCPCVYALALEVTQEGTQGPFVATVIYLRVFVSVWCTCSVSKYLSSHRNDKCTQQSHTASESTILEGNSNHITILTEHNWSGICWQSNLLDECMDSRGSCHADIWQLQASPVPPHKGKRLEDPMTLHLHRAVGHTCNHQQEEVIQYIYIQGKFHLLGLGQPEIW